MLKRTVLLALVLALPALAATPGKHKAWGKWQLAGNGCRPEHTQTLQNGDALSIVFGDFGISMPQGDVGEGASVVKTCHLTIALEPPPGMELDGFEQLYQGGIIKSARSRGRLLLRYHVGKKLGQPHHIDWKEGKAIPPESPDALFAHTFRNKVPGHKCREITSYEVYLQLAGERRDTRNEYFIGGLDSIDAEFRQRVRISPRWRPCRPAR